MTSVNDLNIVIKEFESSYLEIEKENNSLKYKLDKKDEQYNYISEDLPTPEKSLKQLEKENKKMLKK